MIDNDNIEVKKNTNQSRLSLSWKRCLSKYKPHESINTFIAILGLVIACLTAWQQFESKSDILEIKRGEMVVGIVPFKPLVHGNSISLHGIKKIAAGPIFWEIHVYNDQDYPITLKSMNTDLLLGEGSSINYQNIDAGFYDEDFKKIGPPITIKSRYGYKFLVGVNIMVAAEIIKNEGCGKKGFSLSDVEQCIYSKNKSLFGNEVNAEKDNYGVYVPKILVAGDKNDARLNSIYNAQAFPVYVTTLITGDETGYKVSLPYTYSRRGETVRRTTYYPEEKLSKDEKILSLTTYSEQSNASW